MIYFDSEYATIKYFEKEKLIFTTYHGFTPSEELREILNTVLELFSTKDIQLALGDNRNQKVISPADQEFINTVWFPKMLKVSQVIRSASVEPDDIFHNISRDKILQKIEARIPFEFHFFDNLEAACAWLGINPEILAQ